MPPLPPGEDYRVTLHWDDFYGAPPTIRLFRACEPDGGTRYLSDPETAAATVLHSQWNTEFALLRPGETFTFPPDFFATRSRKPFLFEGVARGKAELVLTLYRGTRMLAWTSVWIHITDIKDLYERVWIEDVPTDYPPSYQASRFRLEKTLPADPNESPDMILFIHGINNTVFDWQNTSETFFKRLYWAGYEGRFGTIRWPCDYLPMENTWNPYRYSKSEYFAWKSANGVKNYLHHLRASPRTAGYRIHLVAHSQGNIVASEALKLGGACDSYILSQAAVPAHAYDPSVHFLPELLEAESLKRTPFKPEHGGHNAYFSSLPQLVIANFYNPVDYALQTGTFFKFQANWVENEKSMKPHNHGNVEYFFDFASGESYAENSSARTRDLIVDDYTKRALISRSRSKAIGAEPGAKGVVKAGVDLRVQLNYGITRSEHSAQFSRPIQITEGYYSRILQLLGL
jgi:pimeloyl-ACP methyl ester carboxylesterase